GFPRKSDKVTSRPSLSCNFMSQSSLPSINVFDDSRGANKVCLTTKDEILFLLWGISMPTISTRKIKSNRILHQRFLFLYLFHRSFSMPFFILLSLKNYQPSGQ